MSKALTLDPNSSTAHNARPKYPTTRRAPSRDRGGPARARFGPGHGGRHASTSAGHTERRAVRKERIFRQGDSDQSVRSSLVFWYDGKAEAHFGLEQYGQAIEWAHRAIAIDPKQSRSPIADLIAALALTGRDPEAREALQRYLGSLHGERTIAAWKAFKAQITNEHSDRVILEGWGPVQSRACARRGCRSE